ncbi:UNKNOWN [Stylonychia lemnae]|uniref:Uncharacterized protein n=1 Tax=Stylonychia lemnae TaxID=5949 RepID=A0A078B054_STYLE|nr:UNKNOWN [Stylonychia lemnae]|eukprot:CDW88050.1 UNKNOWN [Stylonychia lemnae]
MEESLTINQPQRLDSFPNAQPQASFRQITHRTNQSQSISRKNQIKSVYQNKSKKGRNLTNNFTINANFLPQSIKYGKRAFKSNTQGQNSNTTLNSPGNALRAAETSGVLSTVDQSDYINQTHSGNLVFRYQSQQDHLAQDNNRGLLKTASGLKRQKIKTIDRNSSTRIENTNSQNDKTLASTGGFTIIQDQQMESKLRGSDRQLEIRKGSIQSKQTKKNRLFKIRNNLSMVENKERTNQCKTIDEMPNSQRYSALRLMSMEPYTGPGDYNIPQVIGSDQICISHIKTPPGYSFSKQPRISLQTEKNPTILLNKQLSDQMPVQMMMNQSFTNANLRKLSPGVGDYYIEKFDEKSKQPRCVIGKAHRFEYDTQRFQEEQRIPGAYQSNLENILSNKGGVIGNQQRFRQNKKIIPGPGDYDIARFHSLSKADVSILAISEERNPDGSTVFSPKFNRSTLSPFCMSQNTLNKTSRRHQELLYHKEYEKAYLNQVGPGPGYYEYEKLQTSMEPEKHKYSIPKVLLFLSLYSCIDKQTNSAA